MAKCSRAGRANLPGRTHYGEGRSGVYSRYRCAVVRTLSILPIHRSLEAWDSETPSREPSGGSCNRIGAQFVVTTFSYSDGKVSFRERHKRSPH
jgi:hypothetical protein